MTTAASILFSKPKLPGIVIKEVPVSADKIIGVGFEESARQEMITVYVYPNHLGDWKARRIVLSLNSDLSAFPSVIDFPVSEPECLIIRGDTIWIFLEKIS
jgi:hypothetical protein